MSHSLIFFNVLFQRGCADGSIIVWNLNNEVNSHQRLDDGHYVAIIDLSFSPNRRWLASIDRDGNLIIRLAKVFYSYYEKTKIHFDC
jgi:WD40 repeat protein